MEEEWAVVKYLAFAWVAKLLLKRPNQRAGSGEEAYDDTLVLLSLLPSRFDRAAHHPHPYQIQGDETNETKHSTPLASPSLSPLELERGLEISVAR